MEVDDDEPSDTKLSEVLQNVRYWHEWKLSYRVREPEKTSIEKTSEKKSRKIKMSIDVPDPSLVGHSRMSKTLEERAAIAANARAREKAKAKRRVQSLKD